MYRRFGPPPRGSDEYKDLCGAWFLTTPDPDVVIHVLPSLCGAYFSFGPYVRSELPAGERTSVLPKERRIEVAKAFRATLMDLLRPVAVHDSYINALGEVRDHLALLGHQVEYDAAGCHGTPKGLVGGADWGQFCALLAHVGDGDVAAGRAVAVDLLRRRALGMLRDEPREARVLAAAWLAPEERGDLFDTGTEWQDPALPDRVAAVAAAIRGGPVDMSRNDLEFSSEDAARAADIVGVLGAGRGFSGAVTEMRCGRRVATEWRRLEGLAGDQDFPDSCIPEAWPSEREVKDLPERLRQAGAATIAGWAEEVLAGPDGYDVLWRTLAALSRRAQRDRTAATPRP